jgi:hypothetical protein
VGGHWRLRLDIQKVIDVQMKGKFSKSFMVNKAVGEDNQCSSYLL